VILIGHIPCNLLTYVMDPILIPVPLNCHCGHNSNTMKMVAAHSSETFLQLTVQCRIKMQNTISWSTYTMKARKTVVRVREGVIKEKMHNVNGYPATVLSHIATVGKWTQEISTVIILYINTPYFTSTNQHNCLKYVVQFDEHVLRSLYRKSYVEKCEDKNIIFY